jgi:outer membrane immunogenic protein
MRINKLLAAIIVSAGLVPSFASADSGKIDWSGFYIGGFAGSGKSDSEWKGVGSGTEYNANSINFADPAYDLGNFTNNLNGTSSVFGLYAGYNLQNNHLVYGLEADYGRLNKTKSAQLDGSEGYVTLESKTKALGSLRARIGYTSDKFLVFGTAGIAFNDSDHKWVDQHLYGEAINSDTLSRSSSLNTGWVAGAGIEYAVTDKVILKGEGLYYDFGSSSSQNQQGANFTVNQDVKVLRAGLAYKF